MSVSAVSIQEINAVRASQPTQQFVVPKKEAKSSSTRRYVDGFSDSKIAEFFTPYGYLNHERSSDGGAIRVICEDCEIILDDFTVLADHSISLFTRNPYFNFLDFADLCAQANTTPSQAIADRLEKEVFNKMPYYVERKKKFNENNLRRIAKDSTYGSLLGATVEKQQHRENFAFLNNYYGSSDPEKIADTLARTIPGR